ncbi:hypothetical protein [Asticcacaulis sp. EMRT-3]|uniref:hypothetical protein n=1 Tax=Asticcacaulis sp. EMRT-3 TaxID=3040349 RepID=UPI0024AFFF53|nr:hypothetical protein [Asticcacaulis sp. EMRT-3]MDI7775578.1 hypothetical protein [Asticcacaulis sp. EMRT-3]
MSLAMLALAACSKPAPQAPAPVAAPAPAYDPWPGTYEGDLMVRISNIHKVTLVAASKDCTGDVGLAGGETPQDIAPDHLRLVLKPDAATTCTIDIVRAGDKVTVSESGICAAYHGLTCSFNGTATRVK